ncbi:MAG: hypothetical protein SOZ74_00610 [Candidatus Fimenecus sp.]|nr:hypothetical protein [Candidatus Fimenecus sp.]
MNVPFKFNYDYSQCIVMKLGMAVPYRENLGKSKVLLTFDEALDYIKKIDNITQGITKIYYLVGWQYLGHDDKYPDFFEVNEALKGKTTKPHLKASNAFATKQSNITPLSAYTSTLTTHMTMRRHSMIL